MSFITPKRYESKASFLPSTSSSSSGGSQFQGIASFIGVDLPSNTNNEVSVLVYQDIVNSLSFAQRLLASPVIHEQKEISYKTYLKDHYRPSVSERALRLLSPSNWFGKEASVDVASKDSVNSMIVKIDNGNMQLLQMMQKSTKLEVIKSSGLVVLEITAPTAEISAMLVQNALGILHEEISAIKTARLRQELNSLELNLNQKKEEFESSQERLARFRDTNQGLSTTLAKTQEEKYAYENDLAFQMFTQASKNFELVKWQLLKETPDFSIIEDVVAPNFPSTPGKKVTVIIYALLGFILSLAFMFVIYLRNLYKKESTAQSA